jgi:HAD superfamily hydrolase (TIGR01484 family)
MLICTDLDRTLIPNGPHPESAGARRLFGALVGRDDVTLAYVTGRHRGLVLDAMAEYRLPQPQFVIGDVGTSLFRIENGTEWSPQSDWESHIASDWAGASARDLQALLDGIAHLRLQEDSKQARFKVSFYVPVKSETAPLLAEIAERLAAQGIRASLIWSVDEAADVGLLDVLPAGATKYHAIEFLIAREGFATDHTLFAGDSGNDLEPLTSPLPAVLVANAHASVRAEALRLAQERGFADRLYCARGGFLGMNGNYSAGILEGVVHYHQSLTDWLVKTGDIL